MDIILIILTFLNNLLFSRCINIYAQNKDISNIIFLPKYTNYDQIQDTQNKIKLLENGDTTYIIGNSPNIITNINDDKNSIGSVNNDLLSNYSNEFQYLNNITIPIFYTNCINPQYKFKNDSYDNVNLYNLKESKDLINEYTNGEFNIKSNINDNNLTLWENGVTMSIVDIIYNSTKSTNRFLFTNVIIIRLNGSYILNGNKSLIYATTLNCYTIIEYFLTDIYKNGTIKQKNKEIEYSDNGLYTLSTYGMINTINAILRDNILDVQFKPGPITKSLFIENRNTLIYDINPNISQTISKLYSLLWPIEGFPRSYSNGLGFKNQTIAYSDLNLILLIIWISLWFILIILSCISIYNLLNIEHDQLSLYKYNKYQKNKSEELIIKFIKKYNDKKEVYYYYESNN